MITINSTSRELSKIELYKMTKSPEIIVLKDVDDGTVIEVGAYCTFTDTKDDGSEVEILSILDKEGEKAYSCQSATFRSSFEDLVTIFNGDCNFSIKKIGGTTRAGRPYIDCVLFAC